MATTKSKSKTATVTVTAKKTVTPKVEATKTIDNSCEKIGKVFLGQIKDDNPENVITMKYSGDHNRFIRQSLALFLTGEKLPIAQCGITKLIEYTARYFKKLNKATTDATATKNPDATADNKAKIKKVVVDTTEESFDWESLVGKKVKHRNGCKGVITKYYIKDSTQKPSFEIEMESDPKMKVRKPSCEIFDSVFELVK